MSMENAIENHAAAITKLAEALVKVFGGLAALSASSGAMVVGDNTTAADTKAPKGVKGPTQQQVADNQAAIEKERADAEAKEEQALEKAVAKVEADAKKSAGSAAAETSGSADPATEQGGSADDAELDYNKDVKPHLLAKIKVVGKEKVLAVIKTYGVEKGDQVAPEDLPELLAKVNALAK